MTPTQYITDALAVIGALYTIASTAASLLPTGSKVQKFLARVAVDLTSLKNDL